MEALFATNAINEAAMEEVEKLLPRFRESAEAQSRTLGRLCWEELKELLFFYLSARLHEVLKICTLRVGNHFTLLGPCIQAGLVTSVTEQSQAPPRPSDTSTL